MKVVRIHGGHVYHVVHESQTNTRRKTAFTICQDSEVDVAEMRDGLPTCSKCVELDNPLKLSVHEKAMIQLLAHGSSVGNSKPQSRRKLIQLDLIHFATGELTRRGKVLALDYTDGTAPWYDERNIAHYREPLSYHTRCANRGPDFPVAEFGKLTVERYDKMRKAGGVVTCFACLALAR